MAAGKASQMITALSSLTAVDIVADAMGDDELRGMGLSPPAVTLRVFSEEEGEEAALLAEVHLGNADPERGIAAQRSGDEVVYRLDYDLAERIPISREAFANRFLSSEEAPERPRARRRVGGDDLARRTKSARNVPASSRTGARGPRPAPRAGSRARLAGPRSWPRACAGSAPRRRRRRGLPPRDHPGWRCSSRSGRPPAPDSSASVVLIMKPMARTSSSISCTSM